MNNSFTQDQAHLTKSDRFVAIKPSGIQEVLADHGFDLVHLKTSKAKKLENRDFQTTVARYRHNGQFEINGLSLDIIFKVPHLYGSLEGVLGLFRGVCSNQLNVGQRFDSIKIRHVGDPLNILNNTIPSFVKQREALLVIIEKMKQTILTDEQRLEFNKKAVELRMGEGVVRHANIQRIRRDADLATDLFTHFNVVQENIVRAPLQYVKIVDDKEKLFTLKRLNESGPKALELNSQLWDAAQDLIAV